MTDHLTIHELQAYRDAIVGEDYDAPKLLPIRITEQLIAAMQREKKVRHILATEDTYDECVRKIEKVLAYFPPMPTINIEGQS